MHKQVIIFLIAVQLFQIGNVLSMDNGEAAEPGEFPFMVSVRDSRNIHICGGTIIGDIWILTGNPCNTRSWFGYIRYGSNLIDDDGILPANRSLGVIKVNESIYNRWADDRPPYIHDCNLLRLAEPIPFSDKVYPTKIPYLDEQWPFNKTGTILGWGQPRSWSNQVALQKATVELYTDEYCHDYDYNGWSIPNDFVMKCGKGLNGAYYCFNDYGGPLIVDGIQYGIMSYIFGGMEGDNCSKYPHIFSPVSYFRKWIEETTGI